MFLAVVCPGHCPLPGSTAVSHPKGYLFVVKIVCTLLCTPKLWARGMADLNGRLGHWFPQCWERWQILKREIEVVPVPCPPAPLFDCAVCQVARAGPLRFWAVAWCGCPAAPQKPEDREGGRLRLEAAEDLHNLLLLLFSFHFHVQNNYVLWSWPLIQTKYMPPVKKGNDSQRLGY